MIPLNTSQDSLGFGDGFSFRAIFPKDPTPRAETLLLVIGIASDTWWARLHEKPELPLAVECCFGGRMRNTECEIRTTLLPAHP